MIWSSASVVFATCIMAATQWPPRSHKVATAWPVGAGAELRNGIVTGRDKRRAGVIACDVTPGAQRAMGGCPANGRDSR